VQGPSRVVFTQHAADRAARCDVPYTDVAEAIIGAHRRRVRNRGAGEWQIRHGRLIVIYDWPHRGDRATARAVTLWIEE
jgi:hypothetical protein